MRPFPKSLPEGLFLKGPVRRIVKDGVQNNPHFSVGYFARNPIVPELRNETCNTAERLRYYSL